MSIQLSCLFKQIWPFPTSPGTQCPKLTIIVNSKQISNWVYQINSRWRIGWPWLWHHVTTGHRVLRSFVVSYTTKSHLVNSKMCLLCTIQIAKMKSSWIANVFYFHILLYPQILCLLSNSSCAVSAIFVCIYRRPKYCGNKRLIHCQRSVSKLHDKAKHFKIKA